MSEIKNCKNCDHWLEPDKTDHRSPAFVPDDDSEQSKFHGRCMAALQYDDCKQDDDTQKECAMLAVDGSGYFAAHFTRPTHSCSEWVVKDESEESK